MVAQRANPPSYRLASHMGLVQVLACSTSDPVFMFILLEMKVLKCIFEKCCLGTMPF